MKYLWQTWSVDELSGNTGDKLKIKFELKTERLKLYQGSVGFNLSGSTAALTFSSKINFSENDQIIFEDYYGEPLLKTNPIFTVIASFSVVLKVK